MVFEKQKQRKDLVTLVTKNSELLKGHLVDYPSNY